MTPVKTGEPAGAGRARVIRGILAVGVASVVMRGGGLIGQYVAGWKLTEADFGLFAVTLAFVTLSVATLSALRPLFIERLANGHEMDNLWRSVLYLLSALAVVLVLISGPLARFLGDADARTILIAMAPTLPLQFYQITGLARLAADHRFADSSRILATAALARHGSLIIFALLGFGVYALILPLYVEALVQNVMLHRAAGPAPRLRGPIAGAWSTHRASLGWLALTAIALAASLNGDYLAIKPFEATAVVGSYFFGYQLSAAITQPFSMAATNVLVPSFATVKDRSRLQRSYIDAISILLLVTGLAFGGLAIVGGPLMSMLWQGKWDDAIVAMVLISIGTPVRILQPTCYSLLQALGRWDLHAKLATFNAIAAVGSAAVGAMVGGLFEIAAFVGIAGVVVGTVVTIVTGHQIGLPASRTLVALLRGTTPAALALAAAFAYNSHLVPDLANTLVRALLYGLIGVAAALALFRSTLKEMMASLKTRRT